MSYGVIAGCRVKEIFVTPKGIAMTDKRDRTRERAARAIFADWEPQDITELVRLISKLAETMTDESKGWRSPR